MTLPGRADDTGRTPSIPGRTRSDIPSTPSHTPGNTPSDPLKEGTT